jgi:CheY-like chemotaxis protein
MRHILIIEDDRDNAESLARLLELLGHDTRVARDGHQALDLARRRRPELILLDIGLPGMDGYEVARRLREEGGCRDAVIIAVSGHGRDEDRRRSLAAGCDHHFLKPSYHEELFGLLTASRPEPSPDSCNWPGSSGPMSGSPAMAAGGAAAASST